MKAFPHSTRAASRAHPLIAVGLLALGALACAHPHASPPTARLTPKSAAPPRDADAALAGWIKGRVAAVPGAVAGVFYQNLSRPADSLTLDADSSFHAASTMKIPVMIQLYRAAANGAHTLDDSVTLRNEFPSIVDGSLYRLDPKDDSDSSLYAKIGQRVALRELLTRMIQRSSNLATNTIIAFLGAPAADSAAHLLGATHMHVLRGVEDGKAFERGLVNTTTARDLATLLLAIQQDRAGSATDCAAMRDILEGQELNTEIPAGLPPGTRVAHKTGQITGVLHDAAIVYPNGGPAYVLVVLTRGIPEEQVARSLIIDISRAFYAHGTASP